MRAHLFASGIAVLTLMFNCGDKAISLGDRPPAPEFTIDDSDANNIIFTVKKAEGFMINWDFGNGELSQKEVDTVYYPFADTYTVSLTASNKGGATTTSEKVVIATTDPKICANRFYTLLAGGCDAESKTWQMINADAALANGPVSAKDANGNGTSSYNDVISYWWRSTLAGTPGDGTNPPTPNPKSLDDEYVFNLKGFVYKNDCHGDFYFSWKWANKLFGLSQEQWHDTICGYTPNNPATWKLDIDSTSPEDLSAKDSTTWKKRYFTDSATGKRFNVILTLSNDNYIGYCSGVSIYQILQINTDTMYLRHELAEPNDPAVTGPNRTEWRYLRLVAKK
jgi:PKD repeat protein